MNNGTVAVLCPMDCECDHIIPALSQKQEKQVGGYLIYEGKIGELTVVVIRCLIGTVNAAICTFLAIERYCPECIILQGTSGAHRIEYDQNDIVIAEKVVSLVNRMSQKRGMGEGTDLFSWEDFGVQTYFEKNGEVSSEKEFYCDARLVELAKKVPYQIGKVRVGTVACADIWNREADVIMHWHNTLGTDCEAMEGVGVAQVCAAFDVPMLEIRVISNNELRKNDVYSIDTAESGQSFLLDFLTLLEKERQSENEIFAKAE